MKDNEGISQTTPEHEAYERGFRAGWQARGIADQTPSPLLPLSPRCSVCGLHGVNGYVCPRVDCPTGGRRE